jgi:hypothetical protein
MEYRPVGPHARWSRRPAHPHASRPAGGGLETLRTADDRCGTFRDEGGRDDWLNDVVTECLAAVNRGVDLHGICMFPAVDMPDWHTGEWLNNGIADLVEQPDGTLKRVPFEPYVAALHQWQRKLGRATALDDDPFDSPVDLADVVEAARTLAPKADADWH